MRFETCSIELQSGFLKLRGSSGRQRRAEGEKSCHRCANHGLKQILTPQLHSDEPGSTVDLSSLTQCGLSGPADRQTARRPRGRCPPGCAGSSARKTGCARNPEKATQDARVPRPRASSPTGSEHIRSMPQKSASVVSDTNHPNGLPWNTTSSASPRVSSASPRHMSE
eukprot:110794-Chlamydomonas_euryale.AAC.2